MFMPVKKEEKYFCVLKLVLFLIVGLIFIERVYGAGICEAPAGYDCLYSSPAGNDTTGDGRLGSCLFW